VAVELRPSCGDCFALCCVALPFEASSDFALTKDAGTPCPNLREDHRCGIHSRLRESGFTGCTVFDCFGAGQRVSQGTFGGADWRRSVEVRKPMFAVFPLVRALHELLWYLTEALALPAAAPLADELRMAFDRTDALAGGTPEELAAVDVDAHRAEVNPLLLEASERARREVKGRKLNRRGADLIGARLAGRDLRGANFRGAYLIAADLSRADLRQADLIGADLRDARLHAADLTAALFLTQTQLDAAHGDARTQLPAALRRPAHWR
jgi:hypothetical protein